MVLGKIVVKSNYEKKGDLVFRPLVRAYINNGFDTFVEGDKASILGIVNNGVFYELFTCEPIPYCDYEVIEYEEFDKILRDLPLERSIELKRLINNLIFHKQDARFNDPSTIDDHAMDRAIEFDAYMRDLTDINPYQDPLGGYDDFTYKCKVLRRK